MATLLSQPDSEKYEELHVHRVYDQIASHFSSTRYKVFLLVWERGPITLCEPPSPPPLILVTSADYSPSVALAHCRAIPSRSSGWSSWFGCWVWQRKIPERES